MPNFGSLAGLEVAEKFLWGVGGVVCTVVFMSNPTGVLCCVGVGVLTKYNNIRAKYNEMLNTSQIIVNDI